MALVTSKEMFAKAYDGGYAIGAFNVNNMEIVQGITEACQEEHATSRSPARWWSMPMTTASSWKRSWVRWPVSRTT